MTLKEQQHLDMKKYTEKHLQKDILDYLRISGFLAVKYPSIGTFNKKTGKYIPMPVKGVSDILFWGNGVFGCVEAKMGYNKPTYQQELFMEEMREKGGVAILAYDLDTVIEILKDKI